MRLRILMPIVFLCFMSISEASEAQAFFANDAHQTTEAFPGAGGSGWEGPWEVTAVLNDTTHLRPKDEWPSGVLENIIEVGEANPLSVESSIHLEVAHQGGPEAARIITLARPMILDQLQPYEVSFKVRVDSLSGNTEGSESFYLRLASTSGEIGETGTTAATGWWIQVSSASEREWQFATNSPGGSAIEFSFVPSGMKLEIGRVYEFTIQADPGARLYSVTLSNGEQTVSKSELGFRESTRPVKLNYLTFGSVAQRQVGLRYSIGEIRVDYSPES